MAIGRVAASKEEIPSILKEIFFQAKANRSLTIDLGGCGLTELPDDLKEMPWLEGLILCESYEEWADDDSDWLKFESHNRILNNRLTILQADILKELKNLKKLYINNRERDVEEVKTSDNLDLTSLIYLTKLEILDISFVKVDNIQPILALKNLKRLELAGTNLTQLTQLTQLPNLRILGIEQFNDLSFVTNLIYLEQLFIDRCKVKDINFLDTLIHLKFLSARSTNIDDLSPIKNLKKIQYLLVGNTPINNLNPLTNLTKLGRLDISNTQINDLSPIKNLIRNGIDFTTRVDVSGCKLENPPIEIVKQGNKAILKYFEEKEKTGTIKAREAKLLILGEGGAGKTSFVRRFKDGMKAAMPKEAESTHGIEVSPYLFPSEDEIPYKVNVWDFGGQEIYHATHQFFLTKRSVYVLVTDTRKEDTDFNYWLQIIELLSDNSPVIIVQNQKGGRIQDFDTGLKKRYKNIIGIYSLDLKCDEKKLKDLCKRIELEIAQLPHVNQEIPSNWQNLRDALEAQKTDKPYISFDAFKELSKANNVESVNIVSQYFHDLGVFLHFQDDAILKHRLFLSNQWVTDGVYKILDDAIVIGKQGHFNLADIKRILGTEGVYADMHDEVLRLMAKFELSYQIPDIVEEEYIAPQLLSKKQPDFEWNTVNNLQLHYEYGFMPKGLLSRLIVRLHRYIKDPKGEAWRTGVVLHRRNAKALIRETFGDRNLYIQAEGSDAKEILTVVSEEIDRLNHSYNRLNVKKLVPCNCSVCRYPERLKAFSKDEEPNFYDYEDLMRRKERGKSTIECQYSYDDVNVLRLLDSVFVTTFFNIPPKKVFISYSKHDIEYLNQLKKHLKPLERAALIQPWDDTKLIAGEDWEKSLKSELLTADIIILLVSSDMIATDYVWDIEMKEAIERHEKGEASVVPVIIRPCAWTETPFARFSALPEKGKPVSSYNNRDDAWTLVVERIKALTEKL